MPDLLSSCRARAATINAAGGDAHVYRNRLVIGRNALGTWTLLLPTIMDAIPFIAAADYVTEADAHSAADKYLKRITS